MTRRNRAPRAAAGLALLAACTAPVAPHASEVPAPRSAGSTAATVRQFGFTVSDLDASLRFFEGLDFERIEEAMIEGPAVAALTGSEAAKLRLASLKLGDEVLQLQQCVATTGRPMARAGRSNDATFQHVAIVVRDIDAAFERVSQLPGFQPTSPGPQTIPLSNAAAGGIRAAYFKDADGHPLELIWFPKGRGNPRWQGARGRLFLGIDHSAIAVANTAVSERFYRALGFDVAGRALNFGPEQAALSGVRGARVEITGLRAAAGPGLEFLSYLEPGPGAAVPPDASPCDLWHWRTSLAVPHAEQACRSIEREGGSCRHVVRGGPSGLPSFLATDPDGHPLGLFE